jgi:twitching motility two-component system response regulator PilH
LAKSAKPDLVLMDVVMPELNGFQATRKLSQDPETKNIPVIMVTTKDQETDRVWGQRQGARGFMVKPVDEVDLLTEIQKFL